MRITRETSSYNHRRMGQPWIAVVDFSKSTKGEYIWGDWTGDHYNGGEGVLSIDCNPGDIIAIGQKDNRQPRNSAPAFYIVIVGGDLEPVGDKGAAYKHYIDMRNKDVDTSALEAEKKLLLKRIVEINELLKDIS